MTDNERIGLIGAMEEEIAPIRGQLSGRETIVHAGISYDVGDWHGVPVVLCKSGVGKVNAAVCTQILIDRFQAGRIIFTGVAGALDPRLDIGDLVISTACMQHDMDVRALGFERGVIPYAEKSLFPADEELVQLARRAGELLTDRQVIEGVVLSGDQFIADKTSVLQLREELGGACIEMEGAAVAQVCSMNGVPYVVIRSMSDKADGSAHADFAEFTRLASANSSRMVEHMVQTIGESSGSGRS